MPGFELYTKLDGFDDLAIKLSKSPDILDDIESKMLKMAALIVQAEAKERAPVDKSNLRKSIQYNLKGNKGSRYAVVGTNVPYAVYQEVGTGIFGPRGTPITPKRGRFLVFETKSGELVFARQVRGTPPKKFMESGRKKLISDMSKVINLGKSLVGNLIK